MARREYLYFICLKLAASLLRGSRYTDFIFTGRGKKTDKRQTNDSTVKFRKYKSGPFILTRTDNNDRGKHREII
jgi:hypothetical protein